MSKLFHTSAIMRGTGTHRRSPLHQDVYVWAENADAVKSFLKTHPKYGYDHIGRPSISSANAAHAERFHAHMILNKRGN